MSLADRHLVGIRRKIWSKVVSQPRLGARKAPCARLVCVLTHDALE